MGGLATSPVHSDLWNKPDLVPSRRAAAVALGAVELDRRASVAVWKARRALVAQAAPAMQATQPAQLSHSSPGGRRSPP